jgi:hypothetical protein
MKVTINRTRSTADGSTSAQLELDLDDWLAGRPELLRSRIDQARGVLDQLLEGDAPPPAPAPGPGNHAPAIATPEPEPPADGTSVAGVDPGPPRDGKALFAWARRRDERLRCRETVAFLGDLGHSWGLARRIVDWPADEATAAYHECLAKLESAPMARGA